MFKKLGMFALLGVFAMTLAIGGCSKSEEDQLGDAVNDAAGAAKDAGKEAADKAEDAASDVKNALD